MLGFRNKDRCVSQLSLAFSASHCLAINIQLKVNNNKTVFSTVDLYHHKPRLVYFLLNFSLQFILLILQKIHVLNKETLQVLT